MSPRDTIPWAAVLAELRHVQAHGTIHDETVARALVRLAYLVQLSNSGTLSTSGTGTSETVQYRLTSRGVQVLAVPEAGSITLIDSGGHVPEVPSRHPIRVVVLVALAVLLGAWLLLGCQQRPAGVIVVPSEAGPADQGAW